MIGLIVADRAGRKSARDLFATGGSARHVRLGEPDQGLDAGTVCRVDPDAGCVREVLARPDTALSRLYAVASRFDLRPEYPPEVLAEVAAIVASPGLDDPALVDMTALPFVTIDNDDSRDLDQALYIEEAPAGGGFLVYYALADASYYVRAGTPLFADALARGASFYLPGLVVPMLPRALSEGLVSLNPQVDRRALVFVMRLDAAGATVTTEIARARVHSHAKLTYDGVQALFDDPASSELSGRAFTRSLELLRVVGERRVALAEAEDVVRYNRVSVNVGLADADGVAFTAVGDRRNDTERYNEQISLLCNIEGARYLAEHHGADSGLRPVFRVHPPPPAPAFDHLQRVIDALVDAHGLDPAVWRWRRRALGAAPEGESLAAYLERLPKGGETRDLFLAIQRQALVMNQRSSFSAEPGLHYGVGAPFYSRFSSPMREVVGVFTHKEALESLAGLPEHQGDDRLHEQVIQAANRSKAVQRQLTKEANLLVIDQLLRGDLAAPEGARPVREGVVLGFKDDRLYLQLHEPPLEVKIYLRDVAAAVGGRYEQVSEVAASVVTGAEVTRAFRLGDRLAVTVRGYDEARRRWLIWPEGL